MSCICEKDTPANGPYYPLNIIKHIKYDRIVNYHYEGYDGCGGYTNDYETVETDSPIYLRVDYPRLYETNGGAYNKRLFHCPLCGRYFPPTSKWEEWEEFKERT